MSTTALASIDIMHIEHVFHICSNKKTQHGGQPPTCPNSDFVSMPLFSIKLCLAPALIQVLFKGRVVVQLGSKVGGGEIVFVVFSVSEHLYLVM